MINTIRRQGDFLPADGRVNWVRDLLGHALQQVNSLRDIQ
jgi:hypothetical protein